MKAVKFKEANIDMGKGQPEYYIVPICAQDVSDHTAPPEQSKVFRFTGKFELSDLEIEQIIKTRSFMFSQFGTHFHPIAVSVENMFSNIPIEYKKEGDTWFAYIPFTDGRKEKVIGFSAKNLIENITDKYPELQAENMYFIENPLFDVNALGDIVGI